MWGFFLRSQRLCALRVSEKLIHKRQSTHASVTMAFLLLFFTLPLPYLLDLHTYGFFLFCYVVFSFILELLPRGDTDAGGNGVVLEAIGLVVPE